MNPSRSAGSLRLVSPREPGPGRELEQASASFLEVAAKWVSEGLAFEHVDLAQSVCAHALRAYWERQANAATFDPWCSVDVPRPIRDASAKLAKTLDGLSLLEAGYALSSLYTSLLPRQVRSELGAYYTPPQLAERLLDLAAEQGADWSSATVLDPACGGGAFLLPVAHRILTDSRIQVLDPESRLMHLERHLFGIEIDEFAAWMTRSLLRLLVSHLSQSSGYAPRFQIQEEDAVEFALRCDRKFDLVVGNPPFGRLKLSEEMRDAYRRSLFGHANIYGLFLDAALRWRNRDGLVAFITPTSFLGGQYFSKLRDVILGEAPPLVIDIVAERKGVFPSVLQETCLTVFGPNSERSTVVHHLSANGNGVIPERAGTFRVEGRNGAPWLLPRSPEQAQIVGRISRNHDRLHDLGYKASTGPLVWNRHKEQLRKKRLGGVLPLIWAEAVRANRFSFEYEGRSQAPYVRLNEGQQHLVERSPCVLIQRTTAKEQSRRIVACAVPVTFVEEWGGLVVENHVNVLRPLGKDAVPPDALAAVLNTAAIDLLFRSISGSVAVSATELHSIPLPGRDLFAEVEAWLCSVEPSASPSGVEEIVASWYGIDFAEVA